MLLAVPGFFAYSLQTEWYVSGTGATIEGNDSNDGTKERPLASVQRALSQIKSACIEEPFASATIAIDGTVLKTAAGLHYGAGRYYPFRELQAIIPQPLLAEVFF